MEWISTVINWFITNLETVLQGVGAFAILATLTPNKTDDKIVQWILTAVNFLGANLGKAKNVDG